MSSYRFWLRNRKPILSGNSLNRLATLGIPALGGLLLLSVILSTKTPNVAQIVAIAALTTGLLALGGRLLSGPGRPATRLAPLEIPFLLAHDRDLFDQYQQLARSLLQVGQRADPIYRTAALAQLSQMTEQLGQIAAGTLSYEGTETWRMVYETLLRSRGIHRYRSVAWLRNVGYWLDEPGLQSMQLNFELQAAVRIERIAIMAEPLWPHDASLPVEPVRQWIHEQHGQGIDIRLVRQTDIAREPDLLMDMGIYGSRAVGFQDLDETCQTVRFTLTFDFDQLAAAEQNWNRLTVYAAHYSKLLDRCTLDAYDPSPSDPVSSGGDT